MSIVGRLRIRYATTDDAQHCQQIARQHRDVLPFVSLPQLRACVAKRELFVAELDGAVVGFVSWHARRDGWQTIYDLAVAQEAQGLGIGRNLLYAVPTPVRLKVTQDNARAITFYEQAGMIRASEETSRNGRALYVYEMRILCVWVQGNNRQVPEMARTAGMAYGTRHNDTPRDYPFMLDIHWSNYEWQDYMHKVATWRPVMAMAPDFERIDQRRALYQQIRDLKAAGVLRVMVCPKFHGAVRYIPTWCVAAISVKSRYAGFEPDAAELTGRKMHLLGGSPSRQFAALARYGGVGRVLSLDTNTSTASAKYGSEWISGQWRRNRQLRDSVDYYPMATRSATNIRSAAQERHSFVQLPMFQETT